MDLSSGSGGAARAPPARAERPLAARGTRRRPRAGPTRTGALTRWSRQFCTEPAAPYRRRRDPELAADVWRSGPPGGVGRARPALPPGYRCSSDRSRLGWLEWSGRNVERPAPHAGRSPAPISHKGPLLVMTRDERKGWVVPTGAWRPARTTRRPARTTNPSVPRGRGGHLRQAPLAAPASYRVVETPSNWQARHCRNRAGTAPINHQPGG
jgi:hypothetical protein